MGADNAEKQGHSAFPSLLPFRHLASTKGCYVTAIYTRAPFPSHPPAHVRQHHMQTKWNCSSALLQVPFLLCLFLLFIKSLLIFPPERVCLRLCFLFFFLQYPLNASATQEFWRETEQHAMLLHARWLMS